MRWLLLLGSVALNVAAGPAHADVVERTSAAEPNGTVEIVNLSGDVEVRGWERAEVHVKADVNSNGARLELEREGAHITVKVVTATGRSAGPTADMVVQIPRDSSLFLRTVSADQTVRDVRGPQQLQAVSGAIDTEVWKEEFRAKTISGDVSVRGRDAASRTTVNTVSGDIELVAISGELAIETVSGEVRLEAGELRRARVQTTNGNVDLRAALVGDARLDAEAINGDVRMRLRQPVNAAFDFETFNGDIETCFKSMPSARKSTPGQQLRFAEGEGAAQVRIKTLNGDIDICSY